LLFKFYAPLHSNKLIYDPPTCWIRLNDLVYVYYNLRIWVKQLEKKPDVKAISLDGIDTIVAWRVEVEESVIETALDWLEDSDDDHGISEEMDHDVPEDIQFHAKSVSVSPTEP
jgi:hypothetical protein